jgi:hypothetical protein
MNLQTNYPYRLVCLIRVKLPYWCDENPYFVEGKEKDNHKE